MREQNYSLAQRNRYRAVVLWTTVAVFFLSGCAGTPRPALYAAPSVLAHTSPAMETAGFWISRLANPDTVVLPPEDIRRFNAHVRDDLKLTRDLSVWPATAPGRELRAKIQEQLAKCRGLLFLDGSRPSSAYCGAMQQALNLEAIPENVVRQYGLIVHYAAQRMLPTDEGLYAQPYDEDFDELQNSALDIATPVVVRHRSLDKKWLFVTSALSSGWVHTQDVALASDVQVRQFWGTSFAVVTSPKADIYLDRARTQFYGTVRMGVRLPLSASSEEVWEVLLPRRQSDATLTLASAFLDSAQVHEGYLAYTPRNILVQAFKMLHQPYGWGGMYAAQDCSRFLQEVFATAGIELPRNSGAQIQVGETLARWPAQTSGEEKLRALEGKGAGGLTLLGMKGHIMLYLSSISGRAYAIHDVWAYRRPGSKGDQVMVLNRVVVSDLSLGEGSRKGSLLERLNAVSIVK